MRQDFYDDFKEIVRKNAAIFRQHTGYSPVEYARIYKLTRSAPALRRTQKTVLDIALDFCFTHNPLKYAEDIVGMIPPLGVAACERVGMVKAAKNCGYRK